ncbi:hypothetical protein SVIOM74S_03261 [Streptomyces violarus]
MSAPNRRGVLIGAVGAAAGLTIAPATALAASQSPERREPLAAGPGKKWDLDGNAQRFRGNTFVCPVPQDSAFFHAETEAMEIMKRSSPRRSVRLPAAPEHAHDRVRCHDAGHRHRQATPGLAR